MDPIYEPLSKEKKQELVARGFKEFEQPYWPVFCDPDEPICNHITLSFFYDYYL